MTDAPLTLAVPSKGRLQENAFAFFARAGLPLVQGRGARDYSGTIAGMDDVEVMFLSASEIARELSQGGAHLGITGEDLIRELIPDADQRLVLLTPLGFGHANVVVAVPQAWIDVRRMADLEDVASAFRLRHGRKMRVATKYVGLTRTFFAEHGVADYRIVESLGATEGAPASGAAELIVDITTTGSTLKANALKVVDDGVILRSEANLAASLRSSWGPRARRAAASILARIAAEEEGRTTRAVSAWVTLSPDAVEMVLGRFGAGLVENGDERRATVLQCPTSTMMSLAEWLIANGAARVSIAAADYVFRDTNPLIEALERRLPQD